MKLKSSTALLLTGLLAFSSLAQELTKPETNAPAPPDKEKVSYALGMHLGLQRKQAGGDTDVGAFIQGLKDVMESKPTQIQESEIASLLNQARGNSGGAWTPTEKDREKIGYALGMRLGVQLKRSGSELDVSAIAQGIRDVVEGKPTRIQESEIPALLTQARTSRLAKRSKAEKAADDAFLAKNAKDPGITVLPDGLQYRIVEAGNGAAPSTNDLIFVKYRGRFINGATFDHNDHFLTRSTGGIKGWQEALQRMKVGSKWQLFVPSELAFGHEGESHWQIGPDSALVYELELLSIARPGDPGVGTGTVGHGLEGEASPPNPAK